MIEPTIVESYPMYKDENRSTNGVAMPHIILNRPQSSMPRPQTMPKDMPKLHTLSFEQQLQPDSLPLSILCLRKHMLTS